MHDSDNFEFQIFGQFKAKFITISILYKSFFNFLSFFDKVVLKILNGFSFQRLNCNFLDF